MIGRVRQLFSSANYGPAFAVIAVILALVIGRELAKGGPIGPVALITVLGAIVFLIRPVNAGIVCLLGVYAVQRLGGTSPAPGSSGGLAYTDALIAVVSIIALIDLLGQPELTRLRGPMIGFGVYLVALLPSLLLHDTQAGYREFVHRIILVAGAMLVGAWIAREKAVDVALRAFVVFSAAVALLAIENAVRRGFAPASPLGLNKNLVGSQLVVAAVLLILASNRLRLALRARAVLTVVILAGAGLCQSRGALVGGGVALFFAVVLGQSLRSRLAKLVVVLLTGIIGLGVYLTVSAQLDSTNSNTNALGQRFNVEKETRRIWRTSPIDGVGMKYFNLGITNSQFLQAPNNVVDNELAESGVLGLSGFVIFQVAVIGSGLRRRRDPMALMGSSIVLGGLVHGQVDIYWGAGVTGLLYLALGIGLADSARDQRSDGPSSAQKDPKMSRSADAMTVSRA